jgi:hypothetical protein
LFLDGINIDTVSGGPEAAAMAPNPGPAFISVDTDEFEAEATRSCVDGFFPVFFSRFDSNSKIPLSQKISSHTMHKSIRSINPSGR